MLVAGAAKGSLFCAAPLRRFFLCRRCVLPLSSALSPPLPSLSFFSLLLLHSPFLNKLVYLLIKVSEASSPRASSRRDAFVAHGWLSCLSPVSLTAALAGDFFDVFVAAVYSLSLSLLRVLFTAKAGGCRRVRYDLPAATMTSSLMDVICVSRSLLAKMNIVILTKSM